MSRFTALILVAFLLAATGQGAVRLEAQPPDEQPPAASAAAADDEEKGAPRRTRRRPRVDSSNTGYIDNAIVGTQFRLRYDSAFDADRPDRAEFIYGKCLCFSGFGQDAASPGPAKDLDFQEFELSIEHAFSERFSLFLEVPWRSVDLTLPAGFAETFGLPDVDESGLGDVRAGFKYALVAEPDRYLTLQLRTYFASGEADKALGTDHASIEPAFLFYRKLSDRVAVESEARWWHPLAGSSDPVTGASNPNSPVGRVERVPPPLAPPDGAVGPDSAVRNDNFAGDVLRFGVGISYQAGGSKVRWAPIAELVGWYFVDGFVTPGTDLGVAIATNPDGTLANPPAYVQEADNDTVVNLKLGARIRGSGPGSFYIGYGFALTDDVLYDGIFRAEYRVGLSGPKRRRAREEEEARGAAAREVAARAAKREARVAAERAEAEAAEAKRAQAAAREAEARKAAAEAAAREAEARRAAADKVAAEAAVRQAEAAARRPSHHVAASPCLNLRPEPALGAPRIACLETGLPASVLDQRDDWSLVRLEDQRQGWVASRFLEAVE